MIDNNHPFGTHPIEPDASQELHNAVLPVAEHVISEESAISSNPSSADDLIASLTMSIEDLLSEIDAVTQEIKNIPMTTPLTSSSSESSSVSNDVDSNQTEPILSNRTNSVHHQSTDDFLSSVLSDLSSIQALSQMDVTDIESTVSASVNDIAEVEAPVVEDPILQETVTPESSVEAAPALENEFLEKTVEEPSYADTSSIPEVIPSSEDTSSLSPVVPNDDERKDPVIAADSFDNFDPTPVAPFMPSEPILPTPDEPVLEQPSTPSYPVSEEPATVFPVVEAVPAFDNTLLFQPETSVDAISPAEESPISEETSVSDESPSLEETPSWMTDPLSADLPAFEVPVVDFFDPATELDSSSDVLFRAEDIPFHPAFPTQEITFEDTTVSPVPSSDAPETTTENSVEVSDLLFDSTDSDPILSFDFEDHPLDVEPFDIQAVLFEDIPAVPTDSSVTLNQPNGSEISTPEPSDDLFFPVDVPSVTEQPDEPSDVLESLVTEPVETAIESRVIPAEAPSEPLFKTPETSVSEQSDIPDASLSVQPEILSTDEPSLETQTTPAVESSELPSEAEEPASEPTSFENELSVQPVQSETPVLSEDPFDLSLSDDFDPINTQPSAAELGFDRHDFEFGEVTSRVGDNTDLFKVADDLRNALLVKDYSRIFTDNNLLPESDYTALHVDGVKSNYYISEGGAQPYPMCEDLHFSLRSGSCCALVSDVKLAAYAVAREIAERGENRSDHSVIVGEDLENQREILYIGSDAALPMGLSCLEFLLYTQSAVSEPGEGAETRRQRIGIMLAQLGFSDVENLPLRDIPYNKRILILAVAAAINPNIGCVIINDPAFHVGPQEDMLARRVFSLLNNRGKCTLLACCSTHLMSSVANRVVVLHRGKLVFFGSYQQFINSHCLGLLSFTCDDPESHQDWIRTEHPAVLFNIRDGVVYLSRNPNEGNVDFEQLLNDLSAHGIAHNSIVLEERSFSIALKEVFVR